jgi:hypothetical protein
MFGHDPSEKAALSKMQDPTLNPYGGSDAQIQNLLAQYQAQPMLMERRDRKISRHKFTPDEDELLRQLMTQYGQGDWALIAQHFPSRNARQCRDRWKHYLSPEVLTGNWSLADDQLLVEKVAELGTRWAAIAQLFPGRTDIGVKNHYISIMGKKARDSGDKSVVGGILNGIGRQFGFDGHQFLFADPRNDDGDPQTGLRVKPK